MLLIGAAPVHAQELSFGADLRAPGWQTVNFPSTSPVAFTAPKHFRLMMACAEICRTSAHFMLIGTEHHKHICSECAEICEECAKDCERVGGMDDCAAECRRCAESCRKMAA